MISPVKIANNFSRVARHYEQYADIQYRLAKRLLEEIKQHNISPESILDIGCGTGKLTHALLRQYPYAGVIGLDVSREMVKVTKDRGIEAVSAGAQRLPFHDETFNLIVSNAAYQWVGNLPAAFQEAHRVLKERGVFVFSCFGKRTLKELRDCFGIEENILPEKGALCEGLKTAGFSEINVERDVINKYFNNTLELLYWLKNTGANRLYQRPPRVSRGRLKEASDFYSRNCRHNGKIYAEFEVFYATARR